MLPGCPDCAEDLLEDEIIRDDLRSLPKSDRVYAEVGTYLYGEGETERASEEELAYFSKNFEELYACASGLDRRTQLWICG